MFFVGTVGWNKDIKYGEEGALLQKLVPSEIRGRQFF